MNTSSSAIAGKVALVTGASRGIGLAIAQSLAQLGAAVGLTARNGQKLNEAVAGLRQRGMRAEAIVADLTTAAALRTLVEQTEQKLGPIEILVNNAGLGRFAPVQKLSEADWDEMLDTNLKAVFLLSKAVAPGMIERGWGHIVNIASLAGKNAFAGGAGYCASKWGLLGLTQCMAEDLRPRGIRVSAICPGSVSTEFSPHAGKDPAKMLQAEDVARAVELILNQAPQSFISEIDLRPAQKP